MDIEACLKLRARTQVPFLSYYTDIICLCLLSLSPSDISSIPGCKLTLWRQGELSYQEPGLKGDFRKCVIMGVGE